MSNAKEAAVSVKLRNVARQFGAYVALYPTDLEIAAGEFVSLLGPSGCGKTTTLRLIAGLETPDSGSILIGDRDVTHVASNRRRLGMVFQNYALFPHMTVAENIGFGLKMAGRGKAEIQSRVERMLDMIHLPGFADRSPVRLSGGQQQRVALARSLITEPSVLLLDEPMAALDKNLRESMQFELRQIQERFGTTTILVTHDQEEALTLSDTVVVMEKGRILQSGSPQEVYRHPATRFVSEFLGASNLIECEILDGAAEGSLRLRPKLPGANPVTVPVAKDAARAQGRTATLVVRPEKIHLHDQLTEGSGICVPATVLQHSFRGPSLTYRLRVEGSDQMLVVYEQARSGAAIRHAGERIFANWSGEAQSLLQDAAN